METEIKVQKIDDIPLNAISGSTRSSTPFISVSSSMRSALAIFPSTSPRMGEN